MCRRWSKIHPEVKLTMKQMISIHHMLNFEPGKDDPSPGIIFEIIIDFTKKNQNFNLKQVFFLSLSNFLEVICYLSESLRNMEKEVPEERTFDSRYQHLDEEMDISYDFDYQFIAELFIFPLETYDIIHFKAEKLGG